MGFIIFFLDKPEWIEQSEKLLKYYSKSDIKINKAFNLGEHLLVHKSWMLLICIEVLNVTQMQQKDNTKVKEHKSLMAVRLEITSSIM